MNMYLKKFLFAAMGSSLLLLFAAAPAHATPNACPAIGFASNCNLLITIGPTLAVTTSLPDPNAYDGVEDQLVGVTNNSSLTITSLTLSGTNIFGFDRDGAGMPGTGCLSSSSPPNPCFSGGPFGPSGYEGPGTSFTITDANNGVVHFTNGLAPGQSIWFSLEEKAAPGSLTSITVGQTPEPASLMLLGTGLVGFFLRRRSA